MNTNPDIHVPSGSGKSFWGPGGDGYRFLITGETSGGSCFTVECLVPPGGGPPMHTHLREDECFYLLEGELEIEVGARESMSGPEISSMLRVGFPTPIATRDQTTPR